jgi:serine protease Do
MASRNRMCWSVVVVGLTVGLSSLSLAQNRATKPGEPPSLPPKELTSYRDLVKSVLPAVVSIEARLKPKGRARVDDLPEEYRRFFDEPPGQPPRQPGQGPGEPNIGFGSGFIIDPKGVIVTNYHVVENAEQVEIFLQDGRKLISKDIVGDKRSDLAIIRVKTKTPLPWLPLGDSDEMEVGDRVLAIGAPFGLTGSVTHGIISAKSRNLKGAGYEDFLQTDAAINPGNSGGPLINLEGKVIGVNTAIKSRSGGFQGIGLAIASNVAKNVIGQLLKDGVVRRGYLGVQIKDLDSDLAEQLGLKEGAGVVITRVFEPSPASKSGMKSGDLVTKIAGKAVRELRELQRIVANLPLNEAVEVEVIRDGAKQLLKLTIEEQPETFGTAGRLPQPGLRPEGGILFEKLGLRVGEAANEVLRELGFRVPPTGVLVTELLPRGPAVRCGVPNLCVITHVNRQPVDTVQAFARAVSRGSLESGILLRVETPGDGVDFILLRSE